MKSISAKLIVTANFRDKKLMSLMSSMKLFMIVFWIIQTPIMFRYLPMDLSTTNLWSAMAIEMKKSMIATFSMMPNGENLLVYQNHHDLVEAQ